ncbi:MAG: class I SAM-dependent methyltransferase [Anaerolineae bacterium]|nr:class I SAM-dependent methyltransferase [Phycisphaerae bacterium]
MSTSTTHSDPSTVKQQATPKQNALRDIFNRHQGKLMTKWAHYFDVYHRHLARFRGAPCTIVEIGIYHGGSLEMWREYFGPQARIIGVDIEERARALAAPGTEIMIGDQSDPAFLKQIAERAGSIDILIDDGGHEMHQQIQTLLHLYPRISSEGVYLCEDLHTSYWKRYGGGLRNPQSFIELSKQLIDKLNAFWSESEGFGPDRFTIETDGLHFYDSMLVVEKRPHGTPELVTAGTPYFDDLDERPGLKQP